LDELEKSVWKHKVVSIIDGYVYIGLLIPFKLLIEYIKHSGNNILCNAVGYKEKNVKKYTW
jgi:hypothetical protein